MIDIKKWLVELNSDLEPDRRAQEQQQYQAQLFEKYVQRNEEHADERAALAESYRQGEDLAGETGLRKQLAAIDLEYFGRAYLPHYFVRESPKFHGELDKIWTDGVLKNLNPLHQAKEVNHRKGRRRAIEAPRGHAKSTTFTFKDAMHAALYAYKNYIIILSDSSEQAEGFLGDIKTEFEDNMMMRADFGNLKGRIWKTSVMLLSNNVKIEAIGSGKKIRGRRHKQWRPDLIILDDIENDENVNTPEQRKKLSNWFYKAVSKAGDTYTDIVYIGTLLHYDSLLANVAKNPEYKTVKYRGVISFATNTSLWDAWSLIYNDLSNDRRQEDALAFFESNKTEMLAGTEVLWEAKLSYYDLMIIKVSEHDAAFNSEIQNEPIDPDSATFQEEWFDTYDAAPPDFSDTRFMFFGANDPSLGKNKRSDTSAIIVVAKDTKTGYMYVIVGSVEKRTPDTIIADAIETSKRLKLDYKRGMYKFGVETVQFQYFFKDVMAQRSAEAGEYLPIEEIQSLQNKDLRIQSLQPLVKNKYIKFSEKHRTLLQQMKEYPMGRCDDGPDALQMAVKLAMDYKGSIGDGYKSVVSRALRFKSGCY